MTIQPSGAITTLPTGTITDQVLSPDGKTLYAARNGTITAYDIASAAVVGSWVIGTQLGGIDISADGKSIVAVELTPGATSGTWPNMTTHYFVYQLDLTSGVSKTFDLPVTNAYPEGYGDISFLPNGNVLIAGGGQWQPLTTLDLTTGATTTTSQTFEAPTLTSSANDSRILVSPLGISDAPLFIYTAGSGITASHQLYADNIMGYNAGVQAISPDGSLSVEGVSLAVYNSNLQLVTKLSDRFPFGAAGLAFSPDGSKLYVLDPVSNEVFVLSTSNWDVLGGYPVGASVTGLSSPYNNATAPATHYGNALLVSADGTHLVVDTAVSVQVIDLTKAISDSGTSAGNDTLIGDSAQNILYGFEGNDTLDGKAGADTMFGGPGNDTYYVDSPSDNVVEKPNEGNDTIYSSYAYFNLPANVETLVLAAGGVTANGNTDANTLIGNDSDNQLFGSAGDDTLVGNGGNDVLEGGTGNDTMQGGSGDDLYYVDSPADVVQESASNGTDKIISSVSYTLGANVENLELSAVGFPLIGTGNGLNNLLIGNGAEDVLYGLAGNDTLVGSAATQYLYGGFGSDTLTGGAGDDVFIGTAAELNGDTITDLSIGDKIVLTDASLANFNFSVSGNTLTYAGGSLTLSQAISGHISASAAASGGVQLTIVENTPPNDFNGDGRSDILWRDTGGTIFNFLGTANGGFVNNGGNSAVTVGGSTLVAGIGDFNGDGRQDILWRASSGSVFDFLATASGGYSNNGDNSFVSIAASTAVVGIGDFNGDRRADILWRDNGGTIFNFLGTANGGYTNNGGNSSVTVATSTQVAGVGDFNGDGVSDILFRDASGNIFDFLATSSGGYSNNGDNSFVSIAAGTVVAGIGDFNGDGRDDILWRDSSGTIFDFLGTANGGFTNNGGNSAVAAGTSLQVASIGDFNGDGRDDILWRDTSGNIFDFLGTANGGFINNGDNSFVAVATTTTVQDPLL